MLIFFAMPNRSASTISRVVMPLRNAFTTSLLA